jgi:hypothetical protein
MRDRGFSHSGGKGSYLAQDPPLLRIMSSRTHGRHGPGPSCVRGASQQVTARLIPDNGSYSVETVNDTGKAAFLGLCLVYRREPAQITQQKEPRLLLFLWGGLAWASKGGFFFCASIPASHLRANGRAVSSAQELLSSPFSYMDIPASWLVVGFMTRLRDCRS